MLSAIKWSCSIVTKKEKHSNKKKTEFEFKWCGGHEMAMIFAILMVSIGIPGRDSGKMTIINSDGALKIGSEYLGVRFLTRSFVVNEIMLNETPGWCLNPFDKRIADILERKEILRGSLKYWWRPSKASHISTRVFFGLNSGSAD